MLCCSEIGPMRWSCQCHISSVFCLSSPPSALHIKLSACQSWFACASRQLIQTWHLNRILAMKHRKGCMCEKVLCKRRDVKNRVREQHVPLEEWKKEKAKKADWELKVDSLNFKLFAFSLPKHKVSIVQTKGPKVSVRAFRAHTRVTTIGLNS